MTQPKKDQQTLRERIQNHLAILKIPLTSEQVDEILAAADKSKLSHLQLLERFLSLPANLRRERGIERRIRLAKFRDPATFESFDWDFNRRTIDQVQFEELATGEFVARRDHLVFAGESGLGKSHLIQAIGRRCCVVGYTVRYTTSAELLEDLIRALGERTLPSRVRYYRRFDLLVIDEFGFEKLELQRQLLQVAPSPAHLRVSEGVGVPRERGLPTPFLAVGTRQTRPTCLPQATGIDYAALRAEVSIRRVLERINYRPLVIQGDQWRGVCPLPHHPSTKARERCFSVNVQRNVYRCFRCHSAGNQLDLWSQLRQLPIYEAARDLCHELTLAHITRETCNSQIPPHGTTEPATPGS